MNDSGDSGGQESADGLSQADIDAALGEASPPSDSAGQDEGSAQVDQTGADGAAEDDSGAVSQNDIDALMKTAGSPAEEGEASAEQATESADERLDSSGRPFDEAAAMMAAAIAEEQAAAPAPASAPPVPDDQRGQDLELPTFDREELTAEARHPISLLHDVQLQVKIELGRTRMLVEDVLRLGEGSVVELEKLAGDPVDVFVNDRLVARGEVLVLSDNFCVRVSEIISEADVQAVG